MPGVKLAKMGHGPHSSKLVVICVVLLLIVLFYVLFVIVLFYVLFVCKCVLYYCHRVLTKLQSTNISISVSCLTPFDVYVPFETKCVRIYISSSTQLFNNFLSLCGQKGTQVRFSAASSNTRTVEQRESIQGFCNGHFSKMIDRCQSNKICVRCCRLC